MTGRVASAIFCNQVKKFASGVFAVVTATSDRLSMMDGEASLATRAAWLYFAAGLTQSRGRDRLNIQSTKAHRLIARASREGMIRVFVEGPVAECVALENTLGPALRAFVLPGRAGSRRGTICR